MRKLRGIFFFLIIAISIFLYIKYSETLKSFLFLQLQKFIPDKVNTEKILYVNDDFSLGDYNNLFTVISKAENSIGVILPQLFNIKIGDYVESLTFEEIKKTQEEHREFIFKLAETPNIILVAFIDNVKTKTKISADPCVFKYFQADDIKLRLKKFNFVKVKNQKIWSSAPDIGFYQNFEYYPYKIPLLYDFNNCVVANVAVEAIRKYYKMNRKSITYSNNKLKIGTIVDTTVSQSGDIIVFQNYETSKVYSLNEFFKLPQNEINDKIIIVNSRNISEHTMTSLGMLIAALIQNINIYHSSILNYIVGFVLFIFFIAFYRLLKVYYGLILMVLLQVGIIIFTFLLLTKNIYVDFVLFSIINFLTFFSVYYYKILNFMIEYNHRAGILTGNVNEFSIKNIIRHNVDLKILNTWTKTFVVYFIFSNEAAENMVGIKNNFAKINRMVYNITDKYFIKLINEKDIIIVFADEVEIKKIIKLLFDIRDQIQENIYNIILNWTEVYTYLHGKQMIFLDKNINVRINAESIEKKRYILVPEKDIQKYIDYIKFHKNNNVGEIIYFNAVGIREEV